MTSDEGDGDEWPAVRRQILDAELFQGLNDVDFTIPAGGMTYRVGEAIHRTDYKDLLGSSEKTNQATKAAVANAGHLDHLVGKEPYPA